jgi:hypothetical protein
MTPGDATLRWQPTNASAAGASPEHERSEAREKKCETRPGYADRLAPLPTAVQVVWLRRNPAWRIVFEQDGVLIFRRVLPP